MIFKDFPDGTQLEKDKIIRKIDITGDPNSPYRFYIIYTKDLRNKREVKDGKTKNIRIK